MGQLDAVTVALWLKPEGDQADRAAVLHGDNWDQGDLHIVLRGNGTLECHVKGNMPSALSTRISGAAWQDGWIHLAVMVDSRQKWAGIALNGEPAAETSQENAVPVDLDSFRLGSWNGQGGRRFFRGAIDDVRIYSGLLSPDALADISESDAIRRARGAAPAPYGQ
jgi:hypothetical protein